MPKHLSSARWRVSRGSVEVKKYSQCTREWSRRKDAADLQAPRNEKDMIWFPSRCDPLGSGRRWVRGYQDPTTVPWPRCIGGIRTWWHIRTLTAQRHPFPPDPQTAKA